MVLNMMELREVQTELDPVCKSFYMQSFFNNVLTHLSDMLLFLTVLSRFHVGTHAPSSESTFCYS